MNKHRDGESREKEGAYDAIILAPGVPLRRRAPPSPSVSAAAAAAAFSNEFQPGFRLPFASPPSRSSRGATRTKLKTTTRARLELEVSGEGEREGGTREG